MNTTTNNKINNSGGPIGITAVTLKGLWANKARFWLSSIAVILSVAFLTAMLILTNALSGTASDDVAAANAGVDFVVLGEELGLGDGPPGAEEIIRAELTPSTVEALLATDGVRDAVGIQTTAAQLLDRNGAAVDIGTQLPVGESWVANPALANFRLVAGTAPVDGVVIDQFLATSAGLSVGDTTRVLTPIGVAEVAIDGIAMFGDAINAPEVATILIRPGDPLLGAATFDRVVVQSTADLAPLQAAIDTGVVQAGPDYVADLQRVIEVESNFQRIFFLAFASIAFVAGTTIIYNTFVIAIAQRTHELALLRSIGATRRQVLRAVMGEAAVIGVIASALGAVAGIASAYGLVELFDAIGFSLLAGSLTISYSSLFIGAGVGFAVTLISAFMPARAAAGTPPIAALRDVAVDPSAVSKLRNRIATVLLVGGVIAAVVGAFQEVWEVAVGGVLSGFVGIVVGGPLLTSLIARVAQAPLQGAASSVGRLATTNAARSPRRSASTALALTLGVALIAFFTVLASSLGGTAAAQTNEAMSADVVVTPFETFAGPDSVTHLPPTIARGIPLADGVEAVVPMFTTMVSVEGAMAPAAGVAIADLDQVYSLDVVAGSLGDVSGNAVALQSGAADGAAIGDERVVNFPGSGELVVTVAAIFDNSLPGQFGADYLFADATLRGAAPDAGHALVLVSTDGSDGAVDAVGASVASIGGGVAQSASEYVDSLGNALDSFLNFVYALLGAAVLIAIVGIANTTVMAIGERTKEIGMLRAVGMTAGQVRRMVRTEALLLSFQGSVLGLAVGVGGAVVTFTALGSDQIAVNIPATSLAAIAVAAAMSGVAAAAWPAWRASNMAPLEAMAA